MSGFRMREPIKTPPRRGHLQLATVAFFMLAVYGSLVPLRYQPIAWDEAIQRFRNIPYLQLSVAGRADWVSNILLFIPLGFLCLGAIAVDQRRDILSIMKAALVVVCCSLSEYRH